MGIGGFATYLASQRTAHSDPMGPSTTHVGCRAMQPLFPTWPVPRCRRDSRDEQCIHSLGRVVMPTGQVAECGHPPVSQAQPVLRSWTTRNS